MLRMIAIFASQKGTVEPICHQRVSIGPALGTSTSPDCSNPQAQKILIVHLPVADATGAVSAADLVAKGEAV